MARMTLAEWVKKMGDDHMGTDVVDGLLRSSATVIFGQPNAGKSLLLTNIVVGLIRGDQMILGRKNSRAGRSQRVMYTACDPGTVGEIHERLDKLDALDVEAQLTIDNLASVDRLSSSSYASWANEVVEEDYDLLIFDNLRARAVGDLNKAEAGQPILGALTDVHHKSGFKTAVVLVAHTGRHDPSHVYGDNGPDAWARLSVGVSVNKDETRTINTFGKRRSDALRLRYEIDPATGAYRLIADEPPTESAAAPRPTAKRKRLREGLSGMSIDESIRKVVGLPLDDRRSAPKVASALVASGVRATEGSIARKVQRWAQGDHGPLVWACDDAGSYLTARHPA
jgi:AAA domain